MPWLSLAFGGGSGRRLSSHGIGEGGGGRYVWLAEASASLLKRPSVRPQSKNPNHTRQSEKGQLGLSQGRKLLAERRVVDEDVFVSGSAFLGCCISDSSRCSLSNLRQWEQRESAIKREVVGSVVSSLQRLWRLLRGRVHGKSSRQRIALQWVTSRLPIAASLLLSGLLFPSFSATVFAQFDCAKLEVPTRVPSHLVAGAWLADELVLPDIGDRKLLAYSKAGKPLGESSGSMGAAFQVMEVLDFRARGHRFGLLRSDGSVSIGDLADGRLQGPMRRVTLLGGSGIYNAHQPLETQPPEGKQEDSFLADQAKIDQVYDWALAGSEGGADSIYLYGDVELRNGKYYSGFMFVPLLAEGQRARLQYDFVTPPIRFPSNTGRLLYRLGYPHIAAIDNRGYILDTSSEEPKIWEYDPVKRTDPKGVPLLSLVELLFPNEVVYQPLREEMSFATGFNWVMAELMRSTVAVALYAWRDNLYLLWHHEDRGWQLTQIVLKRDGSGLSMITTPSVAGTVTLPTSNQGRDLVLVPGDPQWALVERKPEELLHRPVTGIWLVPSDRFDLRSLGGGLGQLCGDR